MKTIRRIHFLHFGVSWYAVRVGVVMALAFLTLGIISPTVASAAEGGKPHDDTASPLPATLPSVPPKGQPVYLQDEKGDHYTIAMTPSGVLVTPTANIVSEKTTILVYQVTAPLTEAQKLNLVWGPITAPPSAPQHRISQVGNTIVGVQPVLFPVKLPACMVVQVDFVQGTELPNGQPFPKEITYSPNGKSGIGVMPFTTQVKVNHSPSNIFPTPCAPCTTTTTVKSTPTTTSSTTTSIPPKSTPTTQPPSIGSATSIPRQPNTVETQSASTQKSLAMTGPYLLTPLVVFVLLALPFGFGLVRLSRRFAPAKIRP